MGRLKDLYMAIGKAMHLISISAGDQLTKRFPPDYFNNHLEHRTINHN